MIQVLVFSLAFQAISWLRETSMLATDSQVMNRVNSTNKLPTLMGKTVTLMAQGKNTVIYFFAPWCQVCHASIGNLQNLYEKNSTIDVIAVALDFQDIDEVREFTKRHHLTFPVALGNETIKHAFSISGYPSYYVLNEENTVIAKSMGYSSELGLYLRSL